MKSYLIVLLLVFIVLSSSYSHKHSSSLSSLSSSLHQYKYNNKNKLVTLYNSINDNGNGSDIIALSNKKSNTNPNLPPYTLNIQQKVYLFLTSLFVSCLIVADVIGVKIFEIK